MYRRKFALAQGQSHIQQIKKSASSPWFHIQTDQKALQVGIAKGIRAKQAAQ